MKAASFSKNVPARAGTPPRSCSACQQTLSERLTFVQGALLLSQYGSNDSHQLGEAAAVHSTWYLALGACGALLT